MRAAAGLALVTSAEAVFRLQRQAPAGPIDTSPEFDCYKGPVGVAKWSDPCTGTGVPGEDCEKTISADYKYEFGAVDAGDAGLSYRGLTDVAEDGNKCVNWQTVSEESAAAVAGMTAGVDEDDDASTVNTGQVQLNDRAAAVDGTESSELATWAGDATKGLGNHSYCRNPGQPTGQDFKRPWCYTYPDFKAMACAVPACPATRDFQDEANDMNWVSPGAPVPSPDCPCAKHLFSDDGIVGGMQVLLQKSCPCAAAFLQAKKRASQKHQPKKVVAKQDPCDCKDGQDPCDCKASKVEVAKKQDPCDCKEGQDPCDCKAPAVLVVTNKQDPCDCKEGQDPCDCKASKVEVAKKQDPCDCKDGQDPCDCKAATALIATTKQDPCDCKEGQDPCDCKAPPALVATKKQDPCDCKDGQDPCDCKVAKVVAKQDPCDCKGPDCDCGQKADKVVAKQDPCDCKGPDCDCGQKVTKA